MNAPPDTPAARSGRMRCEDAAWKTFLLCASALAIFTFSILAMGQNVVGEHTGVAELYVYAGATGVLIGLVLLMPPYRPQSWISGRGEDR